MHPLDRTGRFMAALVVLFALLAPYPRLLGQSTPATKMSASGESETDPRVAFGVIGGSADLAANRSMQALSVLLQYKPFPWLAAAIDPSFVRATAPASVGKGTVSSTGLTDLPFTLTASHSLPHLAWSPEPAAGIELTLPTGDTTTGLGSGQLGVAGDFGLGLSPTDNVSLYVDAWHPFSGAGINTALDATAATSLGFEASYEWTDRWSTTAGYIADVGRADSGATLPQSLAAGFVFKLAAPFALTVDGSHGVTPAAPRWLLSVGLGTAFTATNPLGPASLLGRLHGALGRGVNRGKGGGHVGSCRANSC